MAYHRILTVQDLSCLGQVAGAAALPVLSACGHETCLLPTAVLSNHTAARFGGFSLRDLTEDIPDILQQWKREGITFDGICTGYLASARQIELVQQAIRELAAPDCVKFIDPAMADHGKLYTGFDLDFVQRMKVLCREADVLLPNITEACLLTDTEYREQYDPGWIEALLDRVEQLGPRSVILTGVTYDPELTGVVIRQDGRSAYYPHPKIGTARHGTGDIFAAALAGSYLAGRSLYDAARTAANFTSLCIRNTMDDPDHWYGVKFETALPWLIRELHEE